MKTLKYEQVYLSEYESLADARAQIGHFLEAIYNQKRLHCSLGYLPPNEFEQNYYRIRDKNQTVARRLAAGHQRLQCPVRMGDVQKRIARHAKGHCFWRV